MIDDSSLVMKILVFMIVQNSKFSIGQANSVSTNNLTIDGSLIYSEIPLIIDVARNVMLMVVLTIEDTGEYLIC